MDRNYLFEQIRQKESYLCVGLDTDIRKIPDHLKKSGDPVFEFNRRIIDATEPYCVAYKPNLAFYEALGSSGWESLQKTLEYIPDHIFTIADAKRGDIGNTSGLYARAFFEGLGADALTVAPYMGEDSVRPFFEYENKWVILLAHTSNPGSQDFQTLPVGKDGKYLYEHVIKKAIEWGNPDQMMFVVGATRADKIATIRALVPNYFFLVPGVGSQGGSLKDVSEAGFNTQCGLLVNSSRQIIYASGDNDFDTEAGKQAASLQEEMKQYLQSYM